MIVYNLYGHFWQKILNSVSCLEPCHIHFLKGRVVFAFTGPQMNNPDFVEMMKWQRTEAVRIERERKENF